jgi:SGNH domain (fused to AT3 domains)
MEGRREGDAGVMGWGVRGVLATACLVLLTLGLPVWTPLPSGAAPAARAGLSGGLRIGFPLPAGLTASEHSALEDAGAYGAHPVRLLLLGDSIALTLGMGLSVDAQQRYGVNVTDEATLGCDLDPQLQVFTSGAAGPATQGCDNWRGLWPFLVAGQRPQVVALGLGRWEIADHLLDGHWVHIGEPAWDAHLDADLQSAIDILHSFGAKVVLFTMPYIDPSGRQSDGQPWSENTPDRVRAFNALLHQVAAGRPGVVSLLDLNHMLSPHGEYTATVSGVDVRSTDGIHVTLDGGEWLQRHILPTIDRVDVGDGATRSRT